MLRLSHRQITEIAERAIAEKLASASNDPSAHAQARAMQCLWAEITNQPSKAGYDYQVWAPDDLRLDALFDKFSEA